MKKMYSFNRMLLLFAAIVSMSVFNLHAQTDFKAWEFKTGHSGISGGNLTFTNHSITIEFWMNMSQATASTANSNVFESFLDPNGVNICIRANGTGGPLDLRFFVKDTQATPQAVYFYVPSATYTEKWTHFAFVVSEADQKAYLYVNGELLSEKAAPGGYYGNYKADGTTTRGFNIGGAFWSSPKFYGKMADVRVWSVARTAEEVKANYNKNLEGTNAVNTGLYLNYRFNSFERGVINDANPDNTTNKGWCNPSTDWNTFYGTETLSAYPRNLAIAEGSLSWDTSTGAWEVNVYKADDNTLAFSDTINTNSLSLNSIEELSEGVTYFAKVRTQNNGFWSGQVTSEPFTVTKTSTGIDKIEQQTTVRVSNGSLIINTENSQTVNIYAVSGQLIRRINIVAGENIVSDLSKGVYLVSNQKVVVR